MLVVCWWCVGGVLWVCGWWGGGVLLGALGVCGLVVRGGGVAVPMYVRIAWDCCPWHVGVLVVVWFGGWWCVVLVGWCL